MKFKVYISHKVQKIINALPLQIQEKVLDGLSEIQKNPFQGKALMGNFAGAYSFRAWPYRIIYTIRKKELIVHVLYVVHRKDAYKK